MRLVLCTFLFVGCVAAPPLTHRPVFTIPFLRSATLTVSSAQDRWVDLDAPKPLVLVAPNHVRVLDVRVGEVVLWHEDEDAMLVVDDVDVVWVRPDDRLCATTAIGQTQQARVRAYWGKEELTDQADLSVVRVVRNAVVTDLSDMRWMDPIQSALGNDPEWMRNKDVNNDPCPYLSESETESESAPDNDRGGGEGDEVNNNDTEEGVP